MSIPDWTADGFIPPISQDPKSKDRSPYQIDLVDFIVKYCVTEQREDILKGFLGYRKELHDIGFTKGFQWINGSFMEDIERIENRSPNDIDVVTFFDLTDIDQNVISNLKQELFDNEYVKQTFFVDSYYVQLDNTLPRHLIRNANYWYSMWSHRRSGQWKGYIELDLAKENDHIAMEIFNI